MSRYSFLTWKQTAPWRVSQIAYDFGGGGHLLAAGFRSPDPLEVLRERVLAATLAELERGGRLAGLVTILVAAVLISIALAIEINFRPPLWLQAAVWAPVTVGVVIGVLRLFKTALLYRQYELVREQGE